MGKVVVDLSMSLDGFVAQPDDDAGPLHEWYFTGDTTSRHNKEFRLSEPSREVFDQVFETMGAVIVGRRTYDFTDGWGGSPPIPGAYFVLTHRPPDQPPRGGSSFTFVTDGIERALDLAQEAAGDREVVLMGASVAQQYLRAGLVDELRIHLVPVLLGDGILLFERGAGVRLEVADIVAAPGVTHLTYRVAR